MQPPCLLEFGTCGGLRFERDSAHDETLRRRSDEIEGVARNQRQGSAGSRIENLNVLGPHELDALDLVASAARQTDDLDGVAGRDVLQRAEKPVAVTGDSAVTDLAGFRGPLDPPHAAVQREI